MDSWGIRSYTRLRWAFILDLYFNTCHNKHRHNKGPLGNSGQWGSPQSELWTLDSPAGQHRPAGQICDLWVPRVSLRDSRHSPNAR